MSDEEDTKLNDFPAFLVLRWYEVNSIFQNTH